MANVWNFSPISFEIGFFLNERKYYPYVDRLDLLGNRAVRCLHRNFLTAKNKDKAMGFGGRIVRNPQF